MSDALNPPQISTQDPGAHDLSASESDDHFSSASEGTPNLNNDALDSAIPVTRVERVDDKASHGEVPGTSAYEQRTQDAVPDEVEVVPEGKRPRSGTAASRARGISNASGSSRPSTPGGTPVPRTVVERVDDKPAYGEVAGTQAHEMRMADAEPDEVVRSPPSQAAVPGSETVDEAPLETQQDEPDGEEQRQEWFRSMWEGKQSENSEEPDREEAALPDTEQRQEDAGDEGDFGDDFDEFNEGGEDEDFGDFDEADSTPLASDQQQQPSISQSAPPDALAGLPSLNLSGLTKEETQEAIAPYINTLFPNSEPVMPIKDLPPIDPSKTSPFLSDRSLSLWQQLVSPPPMQPPNWTRSRIRRLFLVSLGVPVDLDEILPPSKQKRLVLPNINLPSGTPRASTALDRLKDQAGINSSTTSVDSKGAAKPPKPKRTGTGLKAPAPPPDFDTNAAALLCSTTEQALSIYSDAELKDHVFTLEVLNKTATEVLEYWLLRKDEGVKEKEALEGVIENLVGFVKGRREGGSKK
ncbi:hypothetical protein KC319_g9183 [Hortaea werneckii]|nr:hypothetical protein KC319_g9183 [Hortaea werneckii]